MKKTLVSMVLLGLVLAVLPGCGSKVSKSNYDKIKNGMTQAEVESILGEGKEQASSAVSVPGMSASAKGIVWEDGGKIISVSFMNGKVVGKSQAGL